MSKICQIPFHETEQQAKKLAEVIAKHKKVPGAVMPVLQQAQDIYGYLPYEVMQRIAEGLDTSMEEIYGVATFYAQFSLYPKGQYNVSVCLGTACYVKSSGEVMDKLKSLLGVKEGEITPDGRFSIQATRCIGCCGLAPVLTVNEEVYGKVTVADVEGIINTYRNK